jgi:ATP-dependent RNA helicase DDX23/PRP28
LQYILQLPDHVLDRVADQGPLALVMAPTRELAIQIDGEFQKMLSRQSRLKAIVVVGGQPIQFQAQQLREGVHVVVGTPGRINDCIESAYLVLNQCCYIVADEADRMVDMGFAPQMASILDAMGGTLKSENEQEAYKQEEADLTNKDGMPQHRLMSMFTATMPLEVERIAKRYLRHPAIISIGDQDSGKNARIVQRVIYLSSPAKKESALRDLILNPRYLREKIIVFVNEKKHADGIGRMVERAGRSCVVLHGGKSQDQREENLQKFRQGGVVLVATDVAGRGLDIPNVAHIINYDLPTRSIDNYSHRIGRTGRAGKEGMATSLMTDEDEGIMAQLKAYLESTGSPVPPKLARHPAANSNTQGNLIY